jgi:hypothetical protein
VLSLSLSDAPRYVFPLTKIAPTSPGSICYWSLPVFEVSLLEKESMKSLFQSKHNLRADDIALTNDLLFSMSFLRIEQFMVFRVNIIST